MQNRAFFCEPYLLTAAQQENPLSVFHSFFDLMHLEQAREYLQDLKETALTSHKVEFSTPQQREDVIYVFRKLEEVLEAAFLVKSMRFKKRKDKKAE